MDFGELLHTAKKNEQARPQIRYYSTKFTPPKKENRTKNVSINVQKFLAKKEAEEQLKRVEAQERKHKLLELRSHDKKATRRVNVMLKRTKSANQSVIADALDTDNTAVTLAGPSQPDEDDYGYVSQESSALYIKMMEKYNKMPEEPKFPESKKKLISTNLSSTKDRVRAALEREKEEALLPHRRKRKHTDSVGENEKSIEKIVELEVEPEKKDTIMKPKFKAAPVVNFSDLLKLAEKKQFEPVVIETKKEEEERPLTKKQKKEAEREREYKERKESRSKGQPEKAPPVFNRIPKLNGAAAQGIEKNAKKVTVEQQEVKKVQKVKEVSSDPQNHKALDRNSNIAKVVSKTPSKPIKSNTDADRKQPVDYNRKVDSQSRQQHPNGVKSSTAKFNDKSKQQDVGRNQVEKPRPSNSNDNQSKVIPSKSLQKKNPIPDGRPKQPPQQNNLKSKEIPSNLMKTKPFPPNDLKPKQFPPNALKPKQFPPNDLKPKQFPPSDFKPKQYPPPNVGKNYPSKDVKRKAMLNKRRIIDDEDYDSEMDDFIDDGPGEEEDYSRYINEIFGYDKRRYQLEDDDVDNMESSFAQQMKEEVISTRIGIMEDLEDIRQEEEAKKKKQQIMKKQKK